MIERTKTYQGKYTSKNGQQHNVRIRVYKKFGTLVLSFALVGTLAGMVGTIAKESDKNNKPNSLEQDPNLLVIDTILKNNPNMLKDVERGTYTISGGDTISAIAERCGNTVKRICSLNKMDSKQVIVPGEVIEVETIKEKEPKDKEIVSLESYFHDYVFASPIAEIAKKAEENPDNGGPLYRSILYGNPLSEVDLDPNSIYGKYVSAYLKFHALENPSEEKRDEYISFLTELSKETFDSLTFGGMSSSLIPYSQYKVYLENGTTKYDTIQETYHSIYS